MCSSWYNNWVTQQHARCNNKNNKKIIRTIRHKNIDNADLDSICSEITLLWKGIRANIKLSLCKSKRYEARKFAQFFLSEHQMEVSDQLYALAVLPLVTFD